MLPQKNNEYCVPSASPLQKTKTGHSGQQKVSMYSQTPPRSPLSHPRKLLASVLQQHSSTVPWHKDIAAAIQSSQWNTVRTNLANVNPNHNSSFTSSFTSSSRDSSEQQRKGGKSFWNRISGRNGRNNDSRDRTGLLVTDEQQRTALHLILSNRKSPVNLVLQLLTAEPGAAATPNNRGRLPLHFAVVYRHDVNVIASLIDAYPAAISFPDSKGQSPLQYAVDIAMRESSKCVPPQTFWMPLPEDCEEAAWQDEQSERWAVVHWLLLSSATHPQTSLSVGGSKPMLVEALLNAASPAVISLLIGASVMLLSYESKASAFAGSTLYTCITRHYPLTILMSLASQCPVDVQKVRDETGMGLVSAQYISGCFEQTPSTQQEWTVSDDFYACMMECMQEGEIGDDPALLDWWRKIEFLVAFCACNKLNHRGSGQKYEPSNLPKEYLLHAALLNVDTPPCVIRMLLALYPESITVKDPNTDALPLHLAAMKRDYIPRSYEAKYTEKKRVMEIILEADRSAVNKRHEGRLPLHYAVGSGRTIESLKPLLEAAATIHKGDDRDENSQLLRRDPKTLLYPFLQAAAYPNKSAEDSFRWTCTARNKYSNAEWKGFPDRKKAIEVLRVAEEEDMARIDTIYELLRRQPGVLGGWQQSQIRSVNRSASSERSVDFPRDSTGKGLVAAHYVSWCFTERMDELKGLTWEPNAEHEDMFRRAVQLALTERSFSRLPSEFIIWWTKMMKYIRDDCRKITPSPAQLENFESVTIPHENDAFLLHSGLSNPDTPPEVIEILLAAHNEAASLYLPGSSLLPLHIAARTPSYISRSFELYQHLSLDLTLQSYPKAARVMSNGRLPLHMAISAGKCYHAIESLVREEPRALAVLDSYTGLYPFQLMASRQEYTSEQRLHFQYLARSRLDEKAWNDLSPQARTKQVQHVQKEHELDVLSSIFLLLELNAALINRLTLEHDDESESQSDITSFLSKNVGLRTPSVATKKSDVSSTEGSDSFFAQSKEMVSPAVRPPLPSSLTVLLSQRYSRGSNNDDDLFESDASVFSNVDVMSTISSTAHTVKKNERALNDFADEESIQIYSFGGEEEVVYDDFAEDSYVQGSFTQVTDCYDEDASEIILQESESSEEGTNLHADDVSIVSFEIRRVPRFSSWKMREGDAAPASVTLSKMPPQSLLAEIKTPSLSSRDNNVKSSSEMSVSSSTIDKNSVPSSYKSLRPDERASMNTSAGMLWISPDLLKTEITHQGDTYSADNENSSVSMSSHRLTDSLVSRSKKSSAQSGLQHGSKTHSTEASISRTGADISTKNSRPGVSRSRSGLSEKSLHLKIARSTNQASLLGKHRDTDTIDDDPLLNMNPDPPKGKGLLSVSHHAHFGEGRSMGKNPASGPSQKSGVRNVRRSASDVAATNIRSIHLLGLDGSSNSVDDDVLLNIDPLTTKMSTESTRATRLMGTNNLPNDSQLNASSSVAPADVTKSHSCLTKSSITPHTASIHHEIEMLYNYAKVSQSTPEKDGADDCVSSDMHTNHSSTAHASEAVVVPVSSKYFDKTSMMWKEHPKEQVCTNQENLNGGAATLKGRVADYKPPMSFDKQSMRWVEKKQTKGQSQRATVCDLAKVNPTEEPLTPQRATAAIPFMAMPSSKINHISKTERHQAASKGRTQFRGRSATNRASNGRATHDQEAFPRLTCLLCHENEIEVLVVPCRHLCICRLCSVRQTSIANCPICDGRVTGIMLIF